MFHLNRLRESIKDATDKQGELIPAESNEDRTQHRFQVTMPVIDPDWSLMIGDFCYDGRASLDYLITALVRSTGNIEIETNQFPIYSPKSIAGWADVEPRWDNDPGGSLKRYLKNTPPGTKAALKPLQPFYGIPSTNPWRHPLALLQTLSNRDKHRRLNLLARAAQINFTDAQGIPVFDAGPPDMRVTDPYESDTYGVTLNGKIDLDVYLIASHHIRFGELGDENVWPISDQVIETLESIDQFIDHRVVPAVKRLL